MAGLNIAEKRLPQDGRIRRKIAGKDIDVRVSTVPTAYGERVVMRILDRSSVLLSLEDLGFEKTQYENMTNLIERPRGIYSYQVQPVPVKQRRYTQHFRRLILRTSTSSR